MLEIDQPGWRLLDNHLAVCATFQDLFATVDSQTQAIRSIHAAPLQFRYQVIRLIEIGMQSLEHRAIQAMPTKSFATAFGPQYQRSIR